MRDGFNAFILQHNFFVVMFVRFLNKICFTKILCIYLYLDYVLLYSMYKKLIQVYNSKTPMGTFNKTL